MQMSIGIAGGMRGGEAFFWRSFSFFFFFFFLPLNVNLMVGMMVVILQTRLELFHSDHPPPFRGPRAVSCYPVDTRRILPE